MLNYFAEFGGRAGSPDSLIGSSHELWLGCLDCRLRFQALTNSHLNTLDNDSMASSFMGANHTTHYTILTGSDQASKSALCLLFFHPIPTRMTGNTRSKANYPTKGNTGKRKS